MADWSALVKGFQEGADFSQRFRSNRQLEKAREQALERGEYDLESTRAFRKTTNPDAASVLGPDYAAGNADWTGQLEDPFAFKLVDWFKKKIGGGGKKKQKALDLGGEGGFNTSNPVGTGEEAPPAETYAMSEEEEVTSEPFADGGVIAKTMEDARGATQSFASQASAVPQTTVQAAGGQPMPSVTGVIDTGRNFADGGKVTQADLRRVREMEEAAERELTRKAAPKASGGRKALDVADDAVGKATGRAAKDAGMVRKAGAGLKRLGAAGALGATAIETASTPTEQYRERFGLETNDPSLLGDIGVRTLGAASDLGNVMTLGAAGNFYRDKQRLAAGQQQAVAPAAPPEAPPQQAIPTEQPVVIGASMSARGARPQQQAVRTGTEPDVVDFSSIDIDAREVPDMKTDDWKKYRAEMIAAAQKSGNPQAVAQVNDMVTDMQLKGFLSYGQQGLALQQAGNTRGAMAAYRAAFQYFPNGNDVEFGTSKNKRTGREQIIGFGKDEKTGKVVPGSELIMDPERVGVLLENFRNPQAFRMWTKDWRDFKQDERKYEEVTKPLAQAQADALANNSEARMLAAENQALRIGMGGRGAGYKQSDMRGDAGLFRDAPQIQQLALEDPAAAQQLIGVMGRIKARYPQLTPDDIVTATMNAASAGTLDEWLNRMGVNGTVPQE
jgi:hypothetical protein